jgi:RIO-like serine/threonine protein kinase
VSPAADVRLPRNVEIETLLGEGRRSRVYRARFDGRDVAIKLYRERYVRSYRERLGISIARFEFDRNLAFCRTAGLEAYAVSPLAVIGEDDGMDAAFVQERITEAVSLEVVRRQEGGVPRESLAALREIVRIASNAGLYDIDLDPRNILLRDTAEGWLPVLHDFNLIPQHLRAPNPLVAFLYRTGLRHPSHRDRRWLRRLERL